MLARARAHTHTHTHTLTHSHTHTHTHKWQPGDDGYVNLFDCVISTQYVCISNHVVDLEHI
jgi:hypothetical protein